MASPAVSYARGNQQRFLNELKDLLRIPSVSTLQEHKSDVQKAAEFVANELRRIGLEHVEIIPTKVYEKTKRRKDENKKAPGQQGATSEGAGV